VASSPAGVRSATDSLRLSRVRTDPPRSFVGLSIRRHIIVLPKQDSHVAALLVEINAKQARAVCMHDTCRVVAG